MVLETLIPHAGPPVEIDDARAAWPDCVAYTNIVLASDMTSFTQVHSFMFHTDPLLSFFDRIDYGFPTVPPDNQ